MKFSRAFQAIKRRCCTFVRLIAVISQIEISMVEINKFEIRYCENDEINRTIYRRNNRDTCIILRVIMCRNLGPPGVSRNLPVIQR